MIITYQHPGAVMYVVQSYNYQSRLVANNSFIIHNSPNCRAEDCFTDIYCYSNSSLISTGAVIFPDGSSYSTDSVISGVNRVEIHESAIHLVVVSNGDGSNMNKGIFTFVIPDANGNMIHLKLGLYRFNRGWYIPLLF